MGVFVFVRGDFVMRKYTIVLVISLLILLIILFLGGCAPADEQYVSTASESETIEKDLLPIVGETGQGIIYQLNEFCFIYENPRNYTSAQAFCMMLVN